MAETKLQKLFAEFEARLESAEKEWLSRYSQIGRDYKHVQELYSRGPAFSMAREVSMSVLEAAKNSFEQALAKAQGKKEWSEHAYKTWVKDAETSSWRNVSARLETIYRTNMQTAMAAGRIQKGRQMGVVGFRRQATPDMDVRDNHLAANGLVYAIDSPDIGWFSLPWGYNCRCTDRPISILEAERLGLVDEEWNFRGMTKEQWTQRGAYPDDGFENKFIEV